MPQLTSIVLKDNAATDHTFAPRDIVGGVTTLVESTGVPIADKTVTVSLNRTATGRRKVNIKLAIPVVQDQVVSGITRPTVVRTAYADLTLTFDGASTTTERADLRSFLGWCVHANTTMMKAVIDDLSAPY